VKIHHVGVIVPSIDLAMPYYVEMLELRRATETVFDPEQDANLVLLEAGGGAPGVELIEPVSEASPVRKQANAGGGYAHICFEVADIVAEVTRMRRSGALTVQSPTPAILFGGRRVAFLFLPTSQLVELVEARLE
jgi:methylmalonyl-CoA/ethylmalonyl-CoA epimerase